MERSPVESSHLVSIGYDEKKSTLEIEFGDAVYQYLGVPPETYRALLGADSLGRYFAREIRGKFQFKKVPAPERAEGAST